MNNPIMRALTRAAGPVGLIGAIGGFLGDIILPLVNIAPFIAGISVLSTLVLAGLLIAQDRRSDKDVWNTLPGGLFMMMAASSLIFSGWNIVSRLGPDRGFIAENVGPIGELQAQLLGLEEDVEEIKETTGETATQVAIAATAQAEGFENLEAALANIQAGEQVIIGNPVSPQDWYNNARVYQLKGDTANAIDAYEGYFSSAPNLEFVDPYEDYIDLINATQGIARARDMLADTSNQNPDNLTAELMLASLLDTTDERIQQLTQLTQRAPQYGPGFFYLGQEYDRKLRETLTNDLLQKQSETYARLFTLEENQAFSVYYIDKLVAQEKIGMAEFQLEFYQQSANTFGTIGVEVLTYQHGVQFILVFPETDGQAGFYSIDDPNPTISLGTNQIGGQSYINQSIGPLEVPVGNHVLYFKYIDKNGVESEVFSHPFEVPPVIVVFTQNPPDFSTGVISGYFLFQVPYADPTDNYSFKYGLNDPELPDQLTGFSIANVPYDDLPVGDHVIYVQALELNGNATEVIAFNFTVE